MRRPVLTLLVALSLLAAGCGDDGDDGATGDTAEETSSTTSTTAATDGGEAGAGGEVELTAANFQFDPATLTVPSGTVTIQLTNEDDAAHTVTIDELDVDVEVPGGESAPVEVTVPESGEVVFYCRFHGSPDGGMRGTLAPESG
jgi:plastocyanin